MKIAAADAGGDLGQVLVDDVVVAELGSGTALALVLVVPVEAGFEMSAGAFDPGSVGHQEVAAVGVE